MKHAKTNGDKTRETLSKMTDEQLIEIFSNLECGYCPARPYCKYINAQSCRDALKIYFDTEADE